MAFDPVIMESIIKGIIVAHSRTGITVHQIAKQYCKCSNEVWPLYCKGESYAMQYLQQIEGVLCIRNEKNELLWYVRGKSVHGDNRGQIYRSNHQPKTNFDLSNNSHGSRSNTCIQNNNKNNGNHNKNNHNGNNKAKVDCNNNAPNGIGAGGHYDYQRNGTPHKYYANNRKRVNGYCSGSPNNDDNGTTESEHKTAAWLYGDYDLVGDDFFMELAKIDLRRTHTMRGPVHRCGLCISGQSIREATERLKVFPHSEKMKIITNLGAVDILHGRDLTDMCQDYTNLVKVCERRGIKISITTVPPIANRLHSDEENQKRCDFNDFLKERFSRKHLVIDLESCMINSKSGKVLFDCYQPSARYVSGSNQPHLLWNRIGRQRVLKAIKAKLRF